MKVLVVGQMAALVEAFGRRQEILHNQGPRANIHNAGGFHLSRRSDSINVK